MKLSVFTPLPPAPTGIADYSELLLRGLMKTQEWDIEARCAGDAAPQPFPVRGPDEDGDDTPELAMYHVGNSEHHDFVYPFLFRRPGVLVLHDLVLHHARLSAYLHTPEVLAYQADLANREKRKEALAKLEAYRDEVVEAYPDDGEAIAEIAIRMGGGNFLYAYPLYEHLVRRSKLTIVHATTARDEVLEHCPESDVHRVRMGIPLPEAVSNEDAKRRLGLPEGIILASFGLVTPEKRIDTAIRALARLRSKGIDAQYFLVGGTVDHYDARREVERLGLGDSVHLTGRVSEDDFWLHAFASDICLNLRYPSAGETSATLLRLLACGRPVVVTDQLHVADFPDSVVARSNLEGDEDGLYCDLMDLIRDDARRRKLAEASRAFVAREHSPDVMVADYAEALASAI